MPDGRPVIYWDASALLGVLLPEERHEEAAAWLTRADVHLVSTLAWAEVHAVLGRYLRTGLMTPDLMEDASMRLEKGGWEYVQDVPDRFIVRGMALRWPLRGADVWHLALAKTLHAERPELRLLSFDERLSAAALGERVAP